MKSRAPRLRRYLVAGGCALITLGFGVFASKPWVLLLSSASIILLGVMFMVERFRTHQVTLPPDQLPVARESDVPTPLSSDKDVERDKAYRLAHADLELRVEQRTIDLLALNGELQRQIAERRRLEKELIEITEGERVRIGQNLHDDLGQQLTGIALLTKSLQDRLLKKRLPEADDAHRIQRLVNESISHTRELARNLTSVRLGGDDLPDALETLATQTRRLFNISCRFKTVGVIPKLEETVSRHFYNIALEAVTNAIKHAKARHIALRLSYSKEELVLVIRNNGQPFTRRTNQPENQGMGLRIMNYRASVVGARLKIGSNRKRGGIVICALPMSKTMAAKGENS